MKLRVQRSKTRAELEVVNGKENARPPISMKFRPRQFPYSSILCHAKSGYFSVGALRRLAKEQIPIFLMEPNGDVLYSMLPERAVKPDTRIGQVEASKDSKRKFQIAIAIVQAKISRSLQLLDWIGQRYDIEKELRLTKHEAMKLPQVSTVAQLRTVEGRTALRYWEAYGKALPQHLEFRTRMSSSRQQRSSNASDPTNASLNYSYGFLEGEVRHALNSANLDPAIGFLHDTADYQTKQSLVYDLMEPYRWIVDLTVFQTFESNALDWPDFYFTADDYRLRFDAESRTRFIRTLQQQFNAKVLYRGERLGWDSIIQEKCSELARYLTRKSKTLDFMEPSPTLERSDNRELRSKILALNSSHAKQLGIPKQTLHDLRTNARSKDSFRIYRKVKEKLERLEPVTV